MSKKDIKQFELALLTDPSDSKLREKLLNAYSRADSGLSNRLKELFSVKKNVLKSNDASTERHVLWIIQNQPHSELAADLFLYLIPEINLPGYKRGLELWEELVEANSQDVCLLRNFARYLTLYDPLRAEQSLRQALILKPGDEILAEDIRYIQAVKSNSKTDLLQFQADFWQRRVSLANSSGDSKLAQLALERQQKYVRELDRLTKLD